MLNEVIDNLPESMSGYDAAAGLADAKAPVKSARARILKRQGRVNDMDDMVRHIKHSKRGQYDGKEE